VLYPDALEIPERWRDDFEMSMSMLREAGIAVEVVDLRDDERGRR
jgi:hypothetical protein